MTGAFAPSLAPLTAQTLGEPSTDEVRRVTGRVLRPFADTVRPVPGTWVVLHRVGPDASGPLDSLRTTPTGGYAFRYRASGSPEAIYFVSAQYHGIAYFSAPLREVAVSGEPAEIFVFDTTSAPVPISIRGRHLVLSAPARGGDRRIIEVYELSNDSTVTRVAGAGEEPVWSALVPPAARDLQQGNRDPDPQAVTLHEGRVRVFTPIAPGLEQIAFSYVVPVQAFPLSLATEREISVLEVLSEEPGTTVRGAGLVEVDAVSVEGRSFRRFLAQNVARGATLTIDVPAPARDPRGPMIALTLLLLGASMLIALAAAFTRRGRRAAPPDRPKQDDAQALAREIAVLDEAFERLPAPTEDARAGYEARRGALKAQLGAALARARSDR